MKIYVFGERYGSDNECDTPNSINIDNYLLDVFGTNMIKIPIKITNLTSLMKLHQMQVNTFDNMYMVRSHYIDPRTFELTIFEWKI